MNITHEQPIRRIATFGFDAPAQLNVPNSLSYTDIDNETGEEFRIAVAGNGGGSSNADIFHAILNMVLFELSYDLQVDPTDPPAWLPAIDDALDTHLRLLDPDLHDRLSAEIAEEAGRKREEQSSIPPDNCVLHVPKLLSEIALVLVEVGLKGGVRKPFIDPDEEAIDRLIQQVLSRVKSSMSRLGRLFCADIVDPRFITIQSIYLEASDCYEAIDTLDDLIIATAISWTANVTTSVIKPVGRRIGFWLADRDKNRISKTVGFDIQSDEGRIRFDLSLSPHIGRGELNHVNLALEMLVGLNTTCDFTSKRQRSLLDERKLLDARLLTPDALAI